MRKFLMLLSLILLFVACMVINQPDIEITRISPLASPVSPGSRMASAETVAVVPKNSVDCYLTEVTWEFYDVSGKMFYRAPEPIPIFVRIKGIVEPAEVETTYIYGIQFPIEPVINYFKQTSHISAEAHIKFVAVDEYTEEKTDTADAWLGLYLMKAYYIVDDTVSTDSASVGDTVLVSARLVDGTNYPIIGDTLYFSASGGTIFPTVVETDQAGSATTKITSTTAGTAIIIIDNPYAIAVQTSVKFY